MSDAEKDIVGRLKPCPFCGSDRITVFNIRDGQQAACKDCKSGGSPTYHGPNGPAATWGEAVKAWNTRAAKPTLRAEVERLTEERDAANATALREQEHACKVSDEAKVGFAALEEEDKFWDACGYPNNRKALTVSEQAASIIRERDAAIARAEKAEAALAKMRNWLREPDWAGDGWSINDWLSRRPTVKAIAFLTQGE